MPKTKLDDKGQRYVLQCLAEFKPNSFIINGLKEKHGIEYLSEPSITYYRNRFKAEIDRHRVEYLRDLASIELTHRKQRLLKLSEWLSHCEKGIPVYIRGPKGLKVEMRPDYGLGLRILEAIREEVKDARFEAGDQADGEEVMEWRLRIEKRYKDMQKQAREFDKKRASPPTKDKEVGEGELVEDEGSTDPVTGSTDPLTDHKETMQRHSEERTREFERKSLVEGKPTDPETDPGTPTPPPEAEDR